MRHPMHRFIESEDGNFSGIAIVANRPDEFGVAPVSCVTAQIIFKVGSEEIHHGFGAWVEHFSNKANFSPGEQRRLVIAMLDEQGPAPNVYAFTNSRSVPLPHSARQIVNVLESDQSVGSYQLVNPLLDIEVTLLGAEGYVLSKFNLKYQREENGGFRLMQDNSQD